VCLVVGLALVHHPIVLAGLPHRSDLPPFAGVDILFAPVAISGYRVWTEVRRRGDARRMPPAPLSMR
jgi:hypothetical protein